MTEHYPQLREERRAGISVCAIAVLYHPQPEVLERLVASTRDQVDRLHLVDNTPRVPGEVRPAARMESESIVYLELGRNMGLAAAQNVGLRKALAEGFSHVLILDQDSELAAHTVSELLETERELLEAGKAVAAVGAMYVDTKTGIPAVSHRYRPFHLKKIRVPIGSAPIETDWLISSGSLIRSKVLQAVGLMREELFIDAIDTEWGLRARSLGWKSFLVPRVTMSHSIGDDKVRLLGRTLMLHSEVRSRYMLRNHAYLLRFSSMGWAWRSDALVNLMVSFLISIWLAQDRTMMGRMHRARIMLGAMLRGFRGQVGALPGSQ